VMWTAAIIGGVGLALTLLGFAFATTRTLYAYLTAYAFAVSVALGALIFILIGHVTRARWLLVMRRLASAVAATLPLLALLFIPIWVGAGEIYPWVDPSPEMTHHEQELLEHKQAYLNVPAFVIRAVIYFALWIATAVLLSRWVRASRRAPTGRHGRARVLAAATLPFVGLTVTFASFDWLMSLQPTWYSSIFGVYYFAGGFLGMLSLLAVLATLGGRYGYLSGLVTGYHFHALGRLMLAFVAFWAYAGFFQLFLIYLANKPIEVPFYVQRLEAGWGGLFFVLVLGHFIVPFFILLSRALKFRRKVMFAVGAWLVVMHYLDVYWLVIPTAPEGGAPHWSDAAALLGVVGLCVAYAVWWLRGDALVPVDDPDIERAVAYRSG
jgi:hypothetical protein